LSTRSPPQCEIVLARNYPLSPNTNQGGDGGATRVRSLGTVRRPDSNGEGNAMSKLGWAAAVVCASATASAAQGLQTLGGHAHHDPLPASLPDRGEFGRSDWADLDGDRRPDAALLEGDAATVLFSAGDALAPLRVSGSFSALCALRDVGAAAHRLALAAQDGVRVVGFDVQAAQFVSTTVLSGAWSNARALRSDDFDGDGDADVAAISANGADVLVALRAGAQWFEASPISVSGDASDVVALQWDGDVALEFAVLTSSGVQVFDDNGAMVRAWTSSIPGGAIARIRQTGQATDRVAWVSAYAPPATQWLRTIAPNGDVEQVDLGALGAYAICAEDFDADGDGDLLIAPRQHSNLLWLENQRTAAQPAGVTFTVATHAARVFQILETSESALSVPQAAWPVVADFDNDGDFDFIVGVEGPRSTTFRFGDWLDESNERFAVTSAQYEVALRRLQIGMSVPASSTFQATHWVVDLWRANNAQSCVNPVAVETLDLVAPTSGSAQIALTLPETFETFDSVYRVRIQPVRRNAQGALLGAGTPTLVGFAVRASASNQLEAEQATESVTTVSSYLPEDASTRPTLVKSARVPPFPSTSPPSHAPAAN